MVMGIVNGIKSCIGAVGDAVKGVADKIKSFLHFSVPDEGPLTDYESWMPDFMGGLAKGIEKSRGMIQKAVSGVSSDMVVSPKVSSMESMTGTGTAAQPEGISGMLSAITSAIENIKPDSGDIVIPVSFLSTALNPVIYISASFSSSVSVSKYFTAIFGILEYAVSSLSHFGGR